MRLSRKARHSRVDRQRGGRRVALLRAPAAAQGGKRGTYTTASHETSDALQGVPEDNVQIPKLGPPLPGDLGRLIAFAQARRVDAASPAIGGGTVRRNPDAARANAAEVARQRVRQENDSAHQQALPCIIWIQSK